MLLWDTLAAMSVPSCLKANNIRQFFPAQRSCYSLHQKYTASKAFEKSFLEYGYVFPAFPCPVISTTEVNVNHYLTPVTGMFLLDFQCSGMPCIPKYKSEIELAENSDICRRGDRTRSEHGAQSFFSTRG